MASENEIPERLKRRPVDKRRGLPIPYVSIIPGDGPEEARADFTAIQAEPVLKAVVDGLCGLCGEPLDYWKAFLGGPRSAESRTYTDPAMHLECAQAAMRLCPHISMIQHKRVPESRLRGEPVIPHGFVDTKPAKWVIGVTRSYTYKFRNGAMLITAAPFKRTLVYAYDEQGRIQEA